MAEPKVKICGITNLADAQRSAELGAWALGMIFHPRSPRRCTREQAAGIAAALRRRVELCGVFVNAPLARVEALADELRLSLLQLHGDEGPAYCREAARRTGCRVIKVARARSRAEVRALGSRRVDFHMIDSAARGVRGGSGVTWDWELVVGRVDPIPLIVSGGLHAGNVADAIAATRPFAVDVASGTEAAPGRKDPERLAAFFAAVSAASLLAEPASP